MKIKSDFITNSSSTSYLIGFKEKLENFKDTSLYKMFNELFKFVIISDKEDLTRFVESYFGELNEEDKLYQRMLNYLENGMIVNFIISYEELPFLSSSFYKNNDCELFGEI